MSNTTVTWNWDYTTSASTTITSNASWFYFEVFNGIITTDLFSLFWIDDKGHVDLVPTEKSLPNGAFKGKLKFNPNLKLKTRLPYKTISHSKRFRQGFQGINGFFKN